MTFSNHDFFQLCLVSRSKKHTTKELTSEINQLSESLDPATISYWRKDEMRQKLKAVKKELDDQVRKAQADLVGIVSTEAKALVEQVRGTSVLSMPGFEYFF